MRTVILWGVFFVLLSPFVYAGLDIQETNLEFGSSSQEKSTATRNVHLAKTLNLRLSAGSNYSTFNYDFTSNNNFQSENIQIVNLFGSVNTSGGDQTRQFIVNLTVPRDFDAVNNNLEPTKFSIGRLRMRSRVNDTQEETSDDVELFLQVKNNLEVVKVTLERADDSENELDDGETAEVEAGERVKLIFDVKNKFENASDTSFGTVAIEIDSSELNLEENEEINGIEPGAIEEARVTTDIDEEETGTFDVHVDVSGEDELQGLHGDKFNFKFRVVAATVDTPDEPTPDTEDADGDGVRDLDDFCPASVPRCSVDENGCEVDSDDDGTCDTLDTTPQGDQTTTLGTTTAQQAAPKDDEPASTNSKTEQDSEVLSTLSGDAFAPFLIGFILGLVLTAGFFIFIRS